MVIFLHLKISNQGLSHTQKIIPISHKSETIQKKENPQMSKFDRRQQRQLQFFMLKKKKKKFEVAVPKLQVFTFLFFNCRCLMPTYKPV